METGQFWVAGSGDGVIALEKIQAASLLGGLCLGILSSCNGGVDLLAILPADTRGRGTDAAALTRSDTDDWGIGKRLNADSAGNLGVPWE